MRIINRKILVIAAALIALAMFALPISAVSATKPTEMDCTLVYLLGGTMTPLKEVTGNSEITSYAIDAPNSQILSGSITGIASYSGIWVVHGPLFMPGTHVTKNGIYTFATATVTDGVTTATGELVIGACANKEHEAGLWRIVSSNLLDSATGLPINVHGNGEFVTTEIPFTIDVVGYLHFD